MILTDLFPTPTSDNLKKYKTYSKCCKIAVTMAAIRMIWLTSPILDRWRKKNQSKNHTFQRCSTSQSRPQFHNQSRNLRSNLIKIHLEISVRFRIYTATMKASDSKGVCPLSYLKAKSPLGFKN